MAQVSAQGSPVRLVPQPDSAGGGFVPGHAHIYLGQDSVVVRAAYESQLMTAESVFLEVRDDGIQCSSPLVRREGHVVY